MDCSLESIGTVRFHQGCFTPLSQLCPWQKLTVPILSNQAICSGSPFLSCDSCLIWRTVTVGAMRAYMIVVDIGKFLHCLVEFFLCFELIQICAFILQCIEVTLHRCIVIGITCFAHTLRHIHWLAKISKCLRCILWALIGMQDQFSFDSWLRIQCFL